MPREGNVLWRRAASRNSTKICFFSPPHLRDICLALMCEKTTFVIHVTRMAGIIPEVPKYFCCVIRGSAVVRPYFLKLFVIRLSIARSFLTFPPIPFLAPNPLCLLSFHNKIYCDTKYYRFPPRDDSSL
eukprot:GEMP01127348.1.p1 GENE.GEMP01127348.1~~GEMP01127348.1.p1  ORF type:complete len:129 (+),score=5.73 GEMP01127348.1:54-440(+)